MIQFKALCRLLLDMVALTETPQICLLPLLVLASNVVNDKL